MALTEETVQDKIEIVGEFKHIQVRTATVIKKDGVEISRSFHRHVVTPDSDTSLLPHITLHKPKRRLILWQLQKE